MKALKFAAVLLAAVAAWQIDMAVNCAQQCVHRPRAVRVQKPQQVAAPQPPQCRGPQCQTPKPLPVPPSSSR